MNAFINSATRGLKSNQGFGIGVGLFFLLLVILVIILILIRLARTTVATVIETRGRNQAVTNIQKNVDEVNEKIPKAADTLGIIQEDVKTTLYNANCAMLPIDGACLQGFVLKDGCCTLEEISSASKKDNYDTEIRRLILMLSTSVIIDQTLTNVIPSLINRGKYINKLTSVLKIVDGKVTSKVGSKLLAKTVAKLAAKLAQKLILRAAIMTLKIMTKLGSGPVGWALLVFDIFSVITDMGDAGNYDSFIANDNLKKMKNMIVYKTWEARRKEGADLPMLFPTSLIFPNETEEATQLQSENFLIDAITLMTNDDKYSELMEDYLILLLTGGTDGNDDIESDNVLDTVLDLVREKEGKKHDKYLYEQLTRIIKNNPTSNSVFDENDIMLVPDMTSLNEIGISITAAAAEKWNKSNEDDWFKYNDPFYPKPEPSGFIQPMYASHSKQYMTVNINNPGNADNPNIIFKDVPKPVTFLYPMGALFAMCLKPRTSAKYKASIDPREHGVTFNNETGQCNYTTDYCNRYGLDKKGNECKLSAGQEVLEFILGTSITRDTKREWQTRVDGLNSNDSATIAKTTALIIVDPTGIFTANANLLDDNFQKNKDRHGTAGAVGLAALDPSGRGQAFVESMGDKLRGREKFCETDDTCKKLQVKHRGGNIMDWSVRNKDGEIYSKGQGFQNQVKHHETHDFYMPTDGFFKVSCKPGESKNFYYEDVNSPFRVSCFAGIIDTSDRDAALVFAENTGKAIGGFAEDNANKAAQEAEDLANAIAKTAAAKAIAEKAKKAAQDAKDIANAIAKTDAGKAIADNANKAAQAAEDLANNAAQDAEYLANEFVNIANGFGNPFTDGTEPMDLFTSPVRQISGGAEDLWNIYNNNTGDIIWSGTKDAANEFAKLFGI
jgi:hypothetical protein